MCAVVFLWEGPLCAHPLCPRAQLERGGWWELESLGVIGLIWGCFLSCDVGIVLLHVQQLACLACGVGDGAPLGCNGPGHPRWHEISHGCLVDAGRLLGMWPASMGVRIHLMLIGSKGVHTSGCHCPEAVQTSPEKFTTNNPNLTPSKANR